MTPRPRDLRRPLSKEDSSSSSQLSTSNHSTSHALPHSADRTLMIKHKLQEHFHRRIHLNNDMTKCTSQSKASLSNSVLRSELFCLVPSNVLKSSLGKSNRATSSGSSGSDTTTDDMTCKTTNCLPTAATSSCAEHWKDDLSERMREMKMIIDDDGIEQKHTSNSKLGDLQLQLKALVSGQSQHDSTDDAGLSKLRCYSM